MDDERQDVTEPHDPSHPELERLLSLLPNAAEVLERLGQLEWSAQCLAAARAARGRSLDFVPALRDFFTPTCEWDDLTAPLGDESLRLGAEAFELLDGLARRRSSPRP